MPKKWYYDGSSNSGEWNQFWKGAIPKIYLLPQIIWSSLRKLWAISMVENREVA